MTLYLIGVIALVALDLIVKAVVTNNMFVGETIPVIRDFFHITYVENRGIAFGIFQGKVNLIMLVTGVVILGIIVYFLKSLKKFDFFERIAYLFIIAGSIGNVVDRMTRGFVVDMFDFRGIWSFVFNIADIYINLGIIFLIIDLLQKRRKN